MTEEARRFVADLVWNDRNFMDLFTRQLRLSSTPTWRRIYGVPAAGEGVRARRLPAGSERAGLLGQALFLALTAKPDETSPTARGLFVREQFLCQHVPDPPPGVNTNLPPVTEAKPQTNRDRMSRARHQPELRRLPQPDRPDRLRLREVRCGRRAARQVQAARSAQRRGEGEGGRRKSPKTVELRPRHHGPGRRHSGFAVLLARGTGRGAGARARSARNAS